jgi:hypothetical protein
MNNDNTFCDFFQKERKKTQQHVEVVDTILLAVAAGATAVRFIRFIHVMTMIITNYHHRNNERQ